MPLLPTSTTPNAENVYLIWGANGWIAGILKGLLESKGKQVHATTARMENRDDVMKVLDEYKPTHVFNCAGCTGRPNVDWCEDNKEATVRSNAIGTLNLTDCCFMEGIHITVFATGCIYTYDEAHPMGGAFKFKEDDSANFGGSFYSFTKSRVEDIMRAYDNCLILRLRMPVSDDLHPRSFVTKITKYAKVVDVPNSQTILSDLLPCSIALAEAREVGVYNFTNPGAISHNEILEMYKELVDPGFKWANFSLDEQAKVLKAGRSNCELDSGKLVRKMGEFGVTIPEVHQAYRDCFKRMREKMDNSQPIVEEALTKIGKRSQDDDLGAEKRIRVSS
ncbi:epimerase/hydratase [Eremomyces bilateralis CBS 781.70]|uniref:Epimerase/hydratase n=1 Tax=Eremomyces bilateralis CBS 781.70 TaxID=1392243 RepID=A0A6G1GEX5_9PEZI|nr:epimerase/hydratase [Eremomyces bilateralis CBS 781.70]KAF1816665.1 epimerase/hydratase [Eremomyces bilateralis CBS 781.70]